MWVGALDHVVRAGVRWRGHGAALNWLITGCWAPWAFALLASTGTVAALILVPADALTTTAYGRLLLAKLGLVTLAAGAALTARDTRPVAPPPPDGAVFPSPPWPGRSPSPPATDSWWRG